MRIIKPAWLSHSGEQKDFEVYSCHVSPDGERLATAGGDGHVRVWSTAAVFNASDRSAAAAAAATPRQLCHMSHHLGTIHAVRFAPNGRYLASGADDKIICIYHLDPNPPPTHLHGGGLGAVFGSGANEPPPVENWKTHKRLVGHDNDVQDLAWSVDGALLVSVGLDSKVVVWSGHTFEKLKTLAGHQSHVKGVTFDPANKFFATASDDRTIKIYKFTPPAPHAAPHDQLNNFVLEATISAPFQSSPLTTYFRRCSWSPDGAHIAAPNAVNGPVSSVAIIERTRWDSEINLIGHEGPTEVCMFSPRLFYTKEPKAAAETSTTNGTTNGAGGGAAAASENDSLVTVIASAGQDKTLCIWNTNTSRPLVILQDLAAKSISDLAWTPDGQTVFAASLDGSIVAVQFEPGELGWVAQAEENDKALQKFGASRKGMGIPEDVDGLHLEAQSKAGELRGAESRMGALMGDTQSKEGSGASTPQPVAATAPTTTTTTTTATNGTAKVSETNGSDAGKKDTESKDGKDKDKDKDKDDKDGKDGKDKTATPTPAPAPPSAEEETAEKRAERIATLKSRVTITKDGRKRVAPLLVSSSGTGQSSLPQAQLVGTAANAGNKAGGGSGSGGGQADALQPLLDLSRPVDRLPPGGIASLLLGNKRKAAVLDIEDDAAGGGAATAAAAGAAGAGGGLIDPTAKRVSNGIGGGGASTAAATAAANAATTTIPGGPLPILTNGVEGVEPAALQPAQHGPVPTPTFLRPAVLNPSITVAQVRLGVPKVRSHIVRPLERGVLVPEGGDGGGNANNANNNKNAAADAVVFEARNPATHPSREPALVTVTKRGVLLWQDYLPRAVLLVTGNAHFWAAACEDGSVCAWTPAGRRLTAPLVLEAQPVVFECRAHWLLCITAVGLAHVWNVRTMRAPHPPVSLAPILESALHTLHAHAAAATPGPSVTSAHLTSRGHVVVTLSNGDGYAYAPALYSWQRLSEAWWAVGSQYWNSNDSAVSALPTTAVGDVPGATDTGAVALTGTVVPPVSAGILPFLERHTTAEFLLKGRAYTLQRLVKALLARDGGGGGGGGEKSRFAGFEAGVSLAHLENRLAGALQLGARDEFRLYLFLYAKRLGAEGLRGKVEELLNSLLGGVLQEEVHGHGNGHSSTDTSDGDADGPSFGWFSRTGPLCGWDRKELLKGVVMILGKFRELQRLTVQYARVLELTQEGEEDGDGEDGHGDDRMVVEA